MGEVVQIDATVYVRRDGAWWTSAHWIEVTELDDPLPRYRVVAIVDGTYEVPPQFVQIAPDRSEQ